MRILPDYFDGYHLHPGASIVSDDPLAISTPAAQWAYALTCRLQLRLTDVDGAVTESLRFVFDVTLVRGRISVGWTSPDGTSFVIERHVWRDTRISFLLHSGAQVGELVFRNIDPSSESSQFIIADARVERVRASASRHQSPPANVLIRRILELALWGTTPFFLIDVGCSGGLQQRWSIFGDRLHAVGFDPLVTEIDRLGAVNTLSGVTYEAAYVGCEGYDQLFPPDLRKALEAKSNQSFLRTSAVAAARQLPTTYLQQVYNAGAPVILTERRITLDQYVSPRDHSHLDFLKVDTDGHDIEVILGATKIMTAGGLLGLHVEVQFHGLPHEQANTFSNIDRVLRDYGFSLFDLDIYRYSRADLPAPFAQDTPAQTVSGQVAWGEALYLRDLASPGYEQAWKYEVAPERVMKLAALFDLFSLPDCAAELLRNRGNFLDPSIQKMLLDLLVSGEPGAHTALLERFERDFTSFYPSEWEGIVPATLAKRRIP